MKRRVPSAAEGSARRSAADRRRARRRAVAERRATQVPATWADRRRRARRIVLDYAVIAIGSILVALAADLFLIPNRVVSGGVVGVATILHYLVGTPVGLVTLLINIPLFAAALLWGGGWRAGVRTIYSVTVMSLAIDLLQPYLPHVSADPLLYTLYGGLLDGLGLGLVLRAGGTTGGTDIVATVLRRLRGVRLGATLLATSALILGAAALIFGLEPALYALIIVYVSSQVVDLVQQGVARTRSFLIISQEHDAIKRAILTGMERGVTVLQATGGYTGEDRPVLLCAIAQREVSQLKRLVHDLDPDAFVIVTAATEVLGEGFGGLTGR